MTRRPWLEVPRLDTEAWFRRCPVHLNAMLIRCTCIQAIGGFNPSLKTSEDTEFILSLSLSGCRFEWLPQITACYRQLQTSLSHSDIPLNLARGLQVRTDLLARPETPEHIRRQKQPILFSFLLWGLNRLLENNCSDQAILDHLVKLLNLSPYAKNKVIYDIARLNRPNLSIYSETNPNIRIGWRSSWLKLTHPSTRSFCTGGARSGGGTI